MKDSPAHKLFKYAMIWRIFYGTIRTGIGLYLLQFIHQPFIHVFKKSLSDEVTEEQVNFIFNAIHSFLEAHDVYVTYFVVGYIIFWGILDIILSANLLRHKLWAFPFSMNLIIFFILYEVFRIFHTHSVVLFFIILIDVLVLWLIRSEYKRYLVRHNLDSNHKVIEGSVVVE